MKRNVFASFILFLCGSVALLGPRSVFGDADDSNDTEVGVYQLPDTTEPISYGLRVKPLIDPANNAFAFDGQVDLVIRAVKYTDEVVLNSRDLNVTAVTGFRDVRTNRSVPVTGYVYDAPNERLLINLGRSVLPPRLYTFTVEFSGVLRDDFTGFHKHLYDSVNGSRVMALTHFKPIYARRAFPCYDEPRFKTPFTISIARRINYYALSNMPIYKSEIYPQSAWAWDHFDRTKPIPTYLVAFMVSDFDKNSMTNDNIAMYTRKELIDDTAYMMRKAPYLLRGVEKFTEIPYMLPKLDLVGVPLLDAYTLGNWGLNSYKENYLTVTNVSLAEDAMLGTMTVLHEILKQWFGNMVTSPRWDYAWTNEGLCNYLSYYIMDLIEPDWALEDKFLENVHQHALAWDEYDDTHPLTFSVLTPNDIVNSFDPITSHKSAALFRMLKHTVGEENFKASLNKYLNDFAYGEAGPKELWEAFDYVLYDNNYVIDQDVTVNNSMYRWSEQPGYPVINVNNYNGSILLTQERFSLSYPRKADDQKWFVGLTYTTERDRNFDDVTPTVWLKPEEQQKTITVPTESGWIIFNLQSIGFYRVNYDMVNWKRLLIQLITDPTAIHVLNRAQIVDDAYHLSRAELIPYKYYISLLEYLLMEDHVTPWNTAISGLSSIMDGLRRYSSEYSQFKEYSTNLAEILYKKLTNCRMSNRTTEIGLGKLMAWSCKSGVSRCEKSASEHFDAWMTGQKIPSEMEEAAFCVGMKNGNLTVWSKMYEFYKTTGSDSYRQIALKALACIENVQTLAKYLDKLMQSDPVSPLTTQNFQVTFKSLGTTPQGVKALGGFLLKKMDRILALKDGHKIVSAGHSVLASKMVTDEERIIINKIKRSAKSVDLGAEFNENYRQAVSNMKWMERNREKIIKAIGKR